MTDFQMLRKNEDGALLQTHNMPRTREDCRKATSRYSGSFEDVTTQAGVMFSKLFEAACRNWGATVCTACGNLSIDTEITTYYRNGVSYLGPERIDLCPECENNIYKAVCGLPPWVKDRDLPNILPALAKAYVETKREGKKA